MPLTPDNLDAYMAAFEERLALAITKGLDVAMAEFESRLRRLEEDQARVLRHIGLDKKR